MNRVSHASGRLATVGTVLAYVLCFGLAAAHAQPPESDNSSSVLGRVDFQSGNLPPATVEVDLTQSMFRDLFGLGDAAVAGVAETLLQSLDTSGDSPEIRLAAEQLEAARQGLQLASNVVREVRIRVHDSSANQIELVNELNSHFAEQLDADGWDHVVRARVHEESVRVSVLRSDGAVRGLFVIAGNDEAIVLANIVCDISPENVKKLTAAATKIGLENGLRQALEANMKNIHRHTPSDPPRPPRELHEED